MPAMPEPVFDHERLDVYRLAIEFVALAGAWLDDGVLAGCRHSAVRHLDDASTSVAANIAEGNGKRSLADRARYLEISRGSALECAACIDVLVARKRLPIAEAQPAKAMLVRIVSMLSKLIGKLAGPGALG
jgi:four helix bundle protein